METTLTPSEGMLIALRAMHSVGSAPLGSTTAFPEHVDCASNGVKNKFTQNELLHDCVREERTAGWHGIRTETRKH